MTDAALTLSRRDDGIAVVTIDTPGESMNVLKAELMQEAATVFDELERDKTVKGVIFASGKAGSFIAGADVRMLAACSTADEATELARGGQALFDRIERFPVPVVAAIDGLCLGGGLELALSCRGRVATDNPKTALGLPEVQLGLLPGSGGTQRLPRLVGIANALDMMLTGKQVGAGRARRIGLVDDVVPATILEQAAAKLALELAQGRRKRRRRTWMERLLETNPLGKRLIFKKAAQTVANRTRGVYPAPPRILECVEHGLQRGKDRGLVLEATRFGELAMTAEARQLMGIYFATVAMKKDAGTDVEVEARPVRRTAVLGAGLMGAGISFVTATRANLPVRLKDIGADGLNRGMKTLHGLINERLKRRSITPFEAELQLRRVTPTTDYSGFSRVDMVIEAVFEDLDLKHGMVRDVESHCGPGTIFATNTSSIPIASIAAAAERPENVIGMHYFSPVEKMPLLEVIATEHTAPEVIAATVELGRRQGKTVIVVRDGAGFYVNRILAPYINEASHLLSEGVAVDRVDEALLAFGFPVGPFALLDEVGLDVSAKVGPILHEAFGDRMKPAATAERLLQDGRRGKKAGKGFYLYGTRSRKGRRPVDQRVYKLLDIEPSNAMAADVIVERTVLMMVNEAARCYEEGVIRSLRDGDIGAVFGIGFPPFRGGPFRYMDSHGAGHIVTRLEALRQAHGERYAPAGILTRMAENNEKFHDDWAR
ncbi:3-hydroxyacyl-CoA dehydrogenase/enoyl-CoA hydratase/3-hydroxybutyryl-CoA epimerase [Natronocella acetinitrilica]|uniref:enoyl-CoA hydratase n=1 Tax=Natronocella acetinitrilica TaxID=414046 RepID=A0AAE3G4U8_9GAMM|nr:fatty acid oxidation complex subunit alpha FadJ [Natronocella acetinitrilica]MCP1675392.1 3-hydroxyacyl-CoA dehydrogenase/enoyl-CoA hydratase/3-hydroxybutyryl-CoA epimerase [Natronocella acetinitrilica]